jgi:hypothetical protein
MQASKSPAVSTSRTRLLVGGGIFVAILATLGVLYATGMLTVNNRQAMVHDRGASIMPFDLNQTTHIFTSTNTGGVEQVIAKDPNNTEQIQLIQQHLQHAT